MNRTLLKATVVLCSIILTFCSMPIVHADSAPVKLVIWSFTNELQHMIEKYYAPNHPELEFEFQIYPTDGSAYETKLDNTLGAPDKAISEEAPDIFTMEAAFVKHYVQSNYTGDLKEVGFTDEELSTEYPVVAHIGQASTGVQKGLSWQSMPGVLVYRASLAEKYLGVKSPEEMQEKVKDWDTFLETAEELKVKSEGACKMVCGNGDIWNVYQYQRSNGWVVDGELYIDDELLDYEELCKTLEQDDLTQKAGAWGETWFAGMRGEIETLCYFLPTWGVQYTLKQNCVAGWDDENPDSEENIRNATENGTYGDWRLSNGPVAYNWGGTWIGTNAAKTAVASNAKKAAIHDLMYFFTLDKDFQTQYAADTGDFVSSTKAVEEILANGGTPNPFLGGQDHYAVFASAAALANGSLMSEYDSTINDLWDKFVTTPYSKGEVTSIDDAIAEFISQVASVITSFNVPDPPKKLLFSISQNIYHESFTSDVPNRYFVMPLNSEAHLTLSASSLDEGSEIALEVTGESIQVTDDTIKANSVGSATITAWIASNTNGEEIESSRITANIVVVDPQKTISIPASVTWLESEAFRGTKAECIIMPYDVWVIESNCFANCVNLKTVIWTGDASGTHVMSPFNSVNSILFLSADGQMPRGLNAVNTGITSFSGFHGGTDIIVNEME